LNRCLSIRTGTCRMKTILLIEDDDATLQCAAQALRERGYRVVAAPDFRDVFDLLDRGEAVDLMITDIRMPPGTPHGFAMARMARLRRPDLKVLYMTGYSDIPEAEIANGRGKVLRKPITPEDLAAEVALALA
jgi:DNA-binding NtrC family response regulator